MKFFDKYVDKFMLNCAEKFANFFLNKNTLIEKQRKDDKNNPEKKLVSVSRVLIIIFKLIILMGTISITVVGYINLKGEVWAVIYYLFGSIILATIVDIIMTWSKEDFVLELIELRKIKELYNNKNDEVNELTFGIYQNTSLINLLTRIFVPITDYIHNEKSRVCFTYLIQKLVYEINDCLNHIKQQGESFTLAVYLYDEEKTLLDLASAKARILKKKDSGRKWEIDSESHISHSYRSGEPCVFYNIQDFLPGLNVKEVQPNDKDIYRASITFPIKYMGLNAPVRAVFCITSNSEGSFSEEHLEGDNARRLGLTKQRYVFLIGAMLEHLFNAIDPLSNKKILSKINCINKSKCSGNSSNCSYKNADDIKSKCSGDIPNCPNKNTDDVDNKSELVSE